MKKKKLTASEKGMKVNEQRFAMIIILTNTLDAENGVSDKIKSAICSSLINLMDNSFIPDDDDSLKDLINISIDRFCAEMEDKHEVENYRSNLEDTVRNARKMVDEIKKKIERIREGEDILKNICLN